MSSHFDEKSGIVICKTSWGIWSQSLEEVNIEVEATDHIRGKDVSVKISPSQIDCTVKGKQVFSGPLLKRVVVDESTWSVEDNKTIRILLVKSLGEADCWTSLFKDNKCAPNAWVLEEMKKKLALERHQIQHPGFDFSSAEISGSY